MIVAAVSFFLVLFLSLRRAVEMWETPRADQALATNISIDHSMVNRRRSSQGPKPEGGCILRCCPSRTRL
jgi:hypothetical protein